MGAETNRTGAAAGGRSTGAISRIALAALTASALAASAWVVPSAVAVAGTEEPHLVAAYDFEDGTARDTTGNGNDLTLAGGASVESYGDKPEGSMALSTRGQTQHAAFPVGMFDGMDEFTLTMNVKNRSTTGNFFTFALGQDNQDYLYLRTRFEELYVGITTDSWQHESGLTVPLSSSIEDEWHHLALVVAPDELSLYLDGRPVGSTVAVDSTISELGTDLKAYLGRSFYEPDAYFDGAYDDIRIWDTALPPEELLAEDLIQVQDTDQVLSQKVRTEDGERILDVTLDYWAPGGNVSGEVTDASELSLDYVVPAGAELSTPQGTDPSQVQDYSEPVPLSLTTAPGSTIEYEVRVHTLVTPVRIPGQEDATGTMGMKFFADPQIFVDGGKYYIYPTTDGHSGWSGWTIHAFVSEDLVHWQDAGVVVDLHDQNLDGTPDSSILPERTEHAWAPAMATRDGKYYLYFSGDGQTNVAVSDRPDGGFELTDAVVSSSIDPAVFQDPQTGTWYYAWGQSGIQYAELNEDMLSYDPDTVYTQSIPGYREASYITARKYQGQWTYYYLYSIDDTNSPNYRVAYATASSMEGPWTYRGEILTKDADKGILGTGHNSVIRVPGTDTWYTAYHAFLTDTMRPRLIDENTGDRIATGNKRETRLARMTFTTPTEAETAAGAVPLIETIPVTYDGVRPEQVPQIQITGSGQIGQTLLAEFNQTWTAVRWQWLRDGEPIEGATTAHYTPTAQDAGAQVSVRGVAESSTGVLNNAGTGPARTGAMTAAPVTIQTGEGPSITTTATSRCLAGSQYLVVTVTNTGTAGLSAEISTDYGDRDAGTLSPQERTTAVFATRSSSIPAGRVTVLAQADGTSTREQPTYDAGSCS